MNLTCFPNVSLLGNVSADTLESVIPGAVLTWTVVTFFVCVIGCCNCFLVLYVSWPRAGDKSGVNLLIFHFVASNLFMVLFHYPIRIIMVQARQSGYVASLTACDFIQTLNTANWLVIVCSDAGLAINRCVALYLPHRYSVYSSIRTNLIQIIGTWLICLAMVVPADFEIGGKNTIIAIGHCAYRNAKDTAYGGTFAVTTLMPYFVNGVASILILIKCYKMSRVSTERRRSSRSEATEGHNTRVQNRIRLAQMLVLTYVFGIVCSVPGNVVAAVNPQLFERQPMANLWPQTCGVAQYAFSPCILFLSNTRYRDRLSKITDRIMPLEKSGTLGMSRMHHRSGKLSMLNSISRAPNDIDS